MLVRLLLRRQSTSWLHVAGLALACGAQALGYWGCQKTLAPTYSSSGQLLYSGGDLRTGGAVSYFQVRGRSAARARCSAGRSAAAGGAGAVWGGVHASTGVWGADTGV